MKKNQKILKILICIVSILIIGYQRKESQRLEIDAVSSVSMNDQEKLVIVANSNGIEDRIKLAKEVLRKYMDNSFQSIRLSTDLREDITCLQVSVYLKENQIKEYNPIMEIEYKLQRVSLEDDIWENPEQVEIFIDGEKIDG